MDYILAIAVMFGFPSLIAGLLAALYLSSWRVRFLIVMPIVVAIASIASERCGHFLKLREWLEMTKSSFAELDANRTDISRVKVIEYEPGLPRLAFYLEPVVADAADERRPITMHPFVYWEVEPARHAMFGGFFNFWAFLLGMCLPKPRMPRTPSAQLKTELA